MNDIPGQSRTGKLWKDEFWDGNFMNQTFEKVLVRMLKAPGGLARGPGITDSTQTKWVLVMSPLHPSLQLSRELLWCPHSDFGPAQ